jgi:uncharacterized membrane protein YeaQ/YmgE (transglycosylase-associated protein family)
LLGERCEFVGDSVGVDGLGIEVVPDPILQLGMALMLNMSIIGWVVLGLIAGFIASKIVNKSGEGVVLDIVLGIIGAVVGGFLFAQFGAEGVTGFNLYSMFVAVIGAIVVLLIYHAVARRRTTV